MKTITDGKQVRFHVDTSSVVQRAVAENEDLTHAEWVEVLPELDDGEAKSGFSDEVRDGVRHVRIDAHNSFTRDVPRETTVEDDFDSMTRAQLMAAAKQAGLPVTNRLRKVDLLELLRGNTEDDS